MRILSLFAFLSCSLAAVNVDVYNLEGALVAHAMVPLPGGAPQRGDYVMHNLPKNQLTWKYTKMQMRGEDIPVVTELAGLRSHLPSTVWALTHVKGGGGGAGGERDDAGLLDVTAEDGDTLRWRLWTMGDLVKARKARATPTPAPTPTAPPAEAADDEDDAAVLARERSGQRAKDVGGEYVVTVEEQEGGAPAEGGTSEEELEEL